MSRRGVVDPRSDTTAEITTGSPRRQQALECQRVAATPTRQRLPVTLNDIHQLAYRKWQSAGRPPGDSTRFWLEAERELLKGW
jgi:hypothetical protein